jgi:hypothetical protein
VNDDRKRILIEALDIYLAEIVSCTCADDDHSADITIAKEWYRELTGKEWFE